MVLSRLLADSEDCTKGGALHERLLKAMEAMKIDAPTPREAQSVASPAPLAEWLPPVPTSPWVPPSPRSPTTPKAAKGASQPARQLRARPRTWLWMEP